LASAPTDTPPQYFHIGYRRDNLQKKPAIAKELAPSADEGLEMLLISAHCERHTLQLNEVKTDPNYPKN
jgi:hypothetical protein